jgi:hypothetical protein
MNVPFVSGRLDSNQRPPECYSLGCGGIQATPDFAAQVAEEYQGLLNLLADDTLRQVAVWKMEGLTNDEVAERLACSRRTVARKLETIRIIWSTETEP